MVNSSTPILVTGSVPFDRQSSRLSAIRNQGLTL